MEKITIIICLFAFAVAAKKKPCICPNTEVTNENLSDAQLQQKNTVLSIINSGLPGITYLGRSYLELLKTYLAGDDVALRNQVIHSMVLQTSLKSFLNGESGACNIAQMINATVNCFGSGSSYSILKAIPKMEKSINQAIDLFGMLNQQASGCPTEAKVSKLISDSCLNNGYTYKIEEIWALRGQNRPTDLRDIVIKMYKSYNLTDKFMALMATNSITPINDEAAFYMVALPAPVEYVNLQANSDIPSCCCKDRLKRIQKLNNQMNPIVGFIIEDQNRIFRAPGACSSSSKLGNALKTTNKVSGTDKK